MEKREPVLSMRDLAVSFQASFGKIRAVRGVNMDVYPGETVAIVGESGSGKSVSVKTIMGIRVEARGSQVTISVIGDGFLYHMVRNIAGLLVDIGLGRRKVEDIKGYLAAKDRRAIGKTAPAQGLCLEEIFFTEERQQEVLRNKYFR